MASRTRTRSALSAAAVAAVLVPAAVVMLLADDAPVPVEPPESPIPPDGPVSASQPASVDAVHRGDPGAVCDAFAAALFTVDASDAGPAQAYRRAAVYATDALTASLVSAPLRGPADWERRVADHGQINAEATRYAGDHIQHDRDALAYRVAVVTTTASGSREGTGQPGRHLVYCTLQLTAEQWQVAVYETERRPPP